MSDYEIQREGRKAQLVLRGKLTAAGVPDLQSALKAELAAGVVEVVINMGETTQIDSTGIGFLIATSNSLATRQGHVQVINVLPDIFGLLRSMRLVDRLRISEAGKESSHG